MEIPSETGDEKKNGITASSSSEKLLRHEPNETLERKKEEASGRFFDEMFLDGALEYMKKE